jgi:hypothetical protein
MDTTSALQCGWAAIHLIGLASTFLIRAYVGRKGEAPLQAVYLLGLAGVALATLAGEQLAWPMWNLSAFTLAAMITLAVAESHPRGLEPHA